jgi:hypothetical protein
MKLYVVMGGWEFEGYDNEMEIFTDKLDAEVYKLELEKKDLASGTPFYDYVDVMEKTLHTGKTLA